ncbi:MAG: hypothetical protein QM759_16855 [Terricaulis sp.]
MTENIDLRDLAEPLWKWLEHNSISLSPSFRRAFDQVCLGSKKAPSNSVVLERIATRLLVDALPNAANEWRQGLGPRESLRKLRDIADFVCALQEFAKGSLQIDLEKKVSFERAFPTVQVLFDQPGDGRISPSEPVYLYKKYISLEIPVGEVERLLMRAALEPDIRSRALPHYQQLSTKGGSDGHAPSLVAEILRVLGGAAVFSVIIAGVWAQIGFKDQPLGEEYIAGWMFGRALWIFAILALLGVIGTVRVWSSNYSHGRERADMALKFRKSALVELYEQSAAGTQTRLFELAKSGANSGEILPEPVNAILQRAAVRSPDDWLIS